MTCQACHWRIYPSVAGCPANGTCWSWASRSSVHLHRNHGPLKIFLIGLWELFCPVPLYMDSLYLTSSPFSPCRSCYLIEFWQWWGWILPPESFQRGCACYSLLVYEYASCSWGVRWSALPLFSTLWKLFHLLKSGAVKKAFQYCEPVVLFWR